MLQLSAGFFSGIKSIAKAKDKEIFVGTTEIVPVRKSLSWFYTVTVAKSAAFIAGSTLSAHLKLSAHSKLSLS